jgi:hypothetical protein
VVDVPVEVDCLEAAVFLVGAVRFAAAFFAVRARLAAGSGSGTGPSAGAGLVVVAAARLDFLGGGSGGDLVGPRPVVERLTGSPVFSDARGECGAAGGRRAAGTRDAGAWSSAEVGGRKTGRPGLALRGLSGRAGVGSSAMPRG